MCALADVQRALNTIREITNKEQAAVRLEVVRLLASTIADEARDIEQSTAPKRKQRRAVRSVPIPKSPNAPKFPQNSHHSSNNSSPTHCLSNPSSP